MLFRLIPKTVVPTVLFTLSFPDIPDALPIPASWTHQLNQLSVDELELPGPAGLHALDKAASLASVIEEVTFDMSTLRITCSLLDGTRQEWPLMETRCMYALESVLFDVNEATTEAERERRKAEAEVRAKSRTPSPPPLPVTTSTPRMIRHKRQRSFLMSIVSFLTPSNPVHVPRQTVVHPSPPTLPPLPPSQTGLSSRDLRRRGRSTLCDLFGRFVIAQLRKRLALSGRGYAFWVAGSMLSRAEDKMAELLNSAAAATALPDFALAEFGVRGEDDLGSLRRLASLGLAHSTTLTLVEPPPDDVHSLAPSLVTDSTTDGDDASVRTPLDSLPPSRGGSLRRLPGLAPAELAQYTTLATLRDRLRVLLLDMERAHAEHAAETRQIAQVLEVKSRRRAWANRCLLLGPNGEGGAPFRYCGLGSPVRRSPLGLTRPFTAADLQEQQAACAPTPWPTTTTTVSESALHALQSPRPRCLSIASGPQDLSVLFGEPEEDDSERAAFLNAAAVEEEEPDLESGLAFRPAPMRRWTAPAAPAQIAPRIPPLTPVTKGVSHRPTQRPRKTSAIKPLEPLGDAFPPGMNLPFPVTTKAKSGSVPRFDNDEWLPGMVISP